MNIFFHWIFFHVTLNRKSIWHCLTMLWLFFYIKKKNNCRYHYQNLDVIYVIYGSWDIEQNILKLVILDHLLPLYPHKNPKLKILKNEKICWRYRHFSNVYQKSQSYDAQFLRYGVRQEELFVILGHFLTFQPPDNPKNQNFKIAKKHLDIL